MLAGDNAYSCDACARKVRAERRLCLEVAPNVLQICLKRFLSVRHWVACALLQLTRALGFCPEVPAAPHNTRQCAAQATSVASGFGTAVVLQEFSCTSLTLPGQLSSSMMYLAARLLRLRRLTLSR